LLVINKPLKWIMNVKDPGSRLLRWRIQLEEYDYEIVYKPGGKTLMQTRCLELMRFRKIANQVR